MPKTHSTPHVFVPDRDCLYRCLLCGCSGYRRKGKVRAHRKPKVNRDPTVSYGHPGRCPTLDEYDRNSS